MKQITFFAALCMISVATFAAPALSAFRKCTAALKVTYVYPDGSVYGSYTYYATADNCSDAMAGARERRAAVEAGVNADPSSPIHIY